MYNMVYLYTVSIRAYRNIVILHVSLYGHCIYIYHIKLYSVHYVTSIQCFTLCSSWHAAMHSATCLVSTQDSTLSSYSTCSCLVHTVLCQFTSLSPSSCTPCQTVLIVGTSDKKYRFGVPFEVYTMQLA